SRYSALTLTWAAFLAASLYLGAQSRALGAGTITVNPGDSFNLTGGNFPDYLINNSGLIYTTLSPGANTTFSGVINDEGLFSLVHPLTLVGTTTLSGSGTLTIAGGSLVAPTPQHFINNSLIIGSGSIGDGTNVMVINNGTIAATTASLVISAPIS